MLLSFIKDIFKGLLTIVALLTAMVMVVIATIHSVFKMCFKSNRFRLWILLFVFMSACGISYADAPTNPPLKVTEEDGSPSVQPTNEIRVTNGTLTDNGDGSVSISSGSSSGDSWVLSSDQVGITGDKSGSFDLTTTGTLTTGLARFNTGTHTYYDMDEVNLDLGSMFEGLTVDIPVLVGHGYSSLPETLDFGFALGTYDRLIILDHSVANKAEIIFAKEDFSNSGGIGANFTEDHIWCNWDFLPDFDNSYELGRTGKYWKKLWVNDITCTNAIAGSITGNAATVTVANEASDTTCFPLFAVDATGSLEPKTVSKLTFNASTGNLGASILSASNTSNQIVLAGTNPYTLTLTGTAASSSKTITFPNTTGTVALTNASSFTSLTSIASSAGAITVQIGYGATTNGTTKAINIGKNGVAGSTTNISFGSTAGGTFTVDNPNVVFNSTSNIVNALTASKLVFTDASKNLTSTGIGTSAQFIKGDGSLDSGTYVPTGFSSLASAGASADQNSVYNFYKTFTANSINTGFFCKTDQLSGGGASSVPIGAIFKADVTGGTFNHAVSLLGWAIPGGTSVVGTYIGTEGRVDNSYAGNTGHGVAGRAALNAADNTGSTNYAGSFYSEATAGAGTGISVGIQAQATGGQYNFNAIFGSGTTSGDNAKTRFAGYITDGTGAANIDLSVEDTNDSLLWDLTDAKIDSFDIKFRDNAGAAKFQIRDSDGTVVSSIDSDGNLTANNRQGYTLKVASSLGNPADSTSYYYGDFALADINFADSMRVYIPRTGTVKAIYVNFANIGTGSNETSTIYFRYDNTTDTTISTGVKNDALVTRVSKTDLAIAVTAGHYFEIKWTTPAWATNPTNVLVSATVYIE